MDDALPGKQMVERYCSLKLPDRQYDYKLQTWLKWCKGNSLRIVPFSKIEVREPLSDMRCYAVDTRFPCILYAKPDGRYIVIDGYHRIKKQMNNNETTGIFFIITPEILHANT